MSEDERDRRGRDVADRLARRFETTDDADRADSDQRDDQTEDSDSPQHSKSSKRSKPSEHSEPSEHSKPTERSKPSDRSRRSERSQQSDSPAASERSKSSGSTDDTRRTENVKEAWKSTYIYLPDDEPVKIHSRLHNEFDRLSYECSRDLGWKPKKNRHYYPVVTLDGVEAIEEMDGESFYERVVELGLAG